MIFALQIEHDLSVFPENIQSNKSNNLQSIRERKQIREIENETAYLSLLM
jgi:hypothetical protein